MWGGSRDKRAGEVVGIPVHSRVVVVVRRSCGKENQEGSGEVI